MSLSWLTRKNVKKGRVSEILLIPVSPLIVQGWEVSKNALPPKQHGHISSNAKQKTASQLMQFSSRYGPLKFVSSFFFVDVRTRICPPETLLGCLTLSAYLTSSFVSRYYLSDVNAFSTIRIFNTKNIQPVKVEAGIDSLPLYETIDSIIS